MTVYVVADARFCQSDERDVDLILNWNHVVQEDDLVLLLGDIVDKDFDNWDKIEEIFDQLIGIKKIISISSDNENAQKWTDVTKNKCFLVNGVVFGTINEESAIVTLYSQPTVVIKEKGLKDSGTYAAAPRSITNNNEIFEDNIISISIDDWGLTPIEYNRIPQMIDDMLLFEKMENKEVNLNETA